ncbi:MAG TPA: COX15/CtaA family protein [Casimicrobiaceae bacterium]|nr:COX15/CtaA family protein [Casimicrobiaceae bacterium]
MSTETLPLSLAPSRSVPVHAVANPHAVASPPANAVANRAIAAWLFACCALVFAMIVVGGVTRLTHSGLSIVEWQPIVGTLPPLTDAQWQEAFAKYRATPEFRLVNQAMDVHAFKGIFWWEYFHRLLGRAIGLVFFVPLVWFAVRRRVSAALAWKLTAIFVLGGLQGAMGWYMVKSGLVDDPRVSQFRLTAHLGLALAIFASMFWLGLSLIRPAAGREGKAAAPLRRDGGALVPLRRASVALAWLVFAMALTGGLVAGIRAGFAYNTFPLMHGHVVPPEILMLDPWWRNFFYNMATVQFDHRALAWVLALVVPSFWWRVRRNPDASRGIRLAADAMLAALAVQIGLGIATLVHVVPLALAALHQAGAVVLFAAALNAAHALSTATARNG